MGFAAKLLLTLIGRIKGLGFLEWAGIASLADTILTYNVKQELYKIVAEEMSARAGLVLDPNEPFSDASVAGAISEKTGITIRSVKDKAMILEDVDAFAARRVSVVLGFQVSSLSDPARARADFEAAALKVVADKTGIPFAVGSGPVAGPDEIRAAVMDWARAQAALELAGDAGKCVQVMNAEGVDFEALAATINGKLVALGSGEALKAADVAMYVSESLVRESVERFGRTAAAISKSTRRRLQVRAAQEKFRSIHGNRQQYVPLGMTSEVS